MNRKKRLGWLLIPLFLSLAGLIYLIISFSPNAQLPILNYKIPVLPIFFLLFFSFLLFLITYLLRSPRRAILIGLLTLVYLVLQMLRLSSPYFLLLLLALYISLELFFKKGF